MKKQTTYIKRQKVCFFLYNSRDISEIWSWIVAIDISDQFYRVSVLWYRTCNFKHNLRNRCIPLLLQNFTSSDMWLKIEIILEPHKKTLNGSNAIHTCRCSIYIYLFSAQVRTYTCKYSFTFDGMQMSKGIATANNTYFPREVMHLLISAENFGWVSTINIQ